MTSRFPVLLIAGALIVLSFFGSSVFIVDQASQAIVLLFGEAQKVHTEPGLKFKLPFIEEVIFYEKRVLDYDLPPVHITTEDQKRLVVDTYTRYSITDPLLFFRTVKPSSEIGAQMRLETLISSSVRNVLGKIPLRTMLSAERSAIMRQIEEEVRTMAKPIGLTILDVRIIKTELPSENRNAVFARMNSELDRFAKENRAKGAEIAQGIKSKAEKERTILIAEAQKVGQINKGEGDAAAIKIATQAFGKDPKFYEFYRTMEMYREAMAEGTSVILSTDSPLFHLFSTPPKQPVE